MGIAFNHKKMQLGLSETRQLSLDSAGNCAFFSHAHSDHVNSRVEHVLASSQTVDLMKARGWKKQVSRLDESAWNSEGITFKLVEAGHVLGSRQLLADSGGETFLYTADFNPNGTLLCPPAQAVPEVDSMLVESTFGKPSFVFPPFTQVCQQISGWVDKSVDSGASVVLGGYSLGKAQELVRLLNEFNGITPLVNDTVASVCREYNKHGCKLDFVDSSTPEGQSALTRSFVAVLPHHQVRPELAGKLSEFCGRKVKTALATGWASSTNFAGVDRAFTLSSHADFRGLVSFVQACNPKKVYCNHGFSRELANELKKLGFDAVSVDDIDFFKNQKGLASFIAE